MWPFPAVVCTSYTAHESFIHIVFPVDDAWLLHTSPIEQKLSYTLIQWLKVFKFTSKDISNSPWWKLAFVLGSAWASPKGEKATIQWHLSLGSPETVVKPGIKFYPCNVLREYLYSWGQTHSESIFARCVSNTFHTLPWNLKTFFSKALWFLRP